MHGGIAMLHATVVTGTDEATLGVKDSGSNRNATFGQALAGLLKSDRQHRMRVPFGLHPSSPTLGGAWSCPGTPEPKVVVTERWGVPGFLR
jgi:hypothetical protein